MQREPVGLIGVGLLGLALAERFLKSGLAVCGYDPLPARREALAAAGGRPLDSAPAVAAACDRLVFSLPNSEVVEAVIVDLDPALRPGLLVLDTTTGDPERTEALGRSLARRGVGYLDATVIGSSELARAGEVVVTVGGERADLDRGRDLLDRFARQVFPVGPCGSGARMKLVVNLVLGLNRAVLAEGLSLARACGVEPAEALRVLQAGAAYSRVMDVKGPKMLAGDYAPQARLAQHLKDVHLILAEGQRSGAVLPFTGLHRDLLQRLCAAGLGDLDNSAILRAYDRVPRD